MTVKIGVLAVQGDFAEHIDALDGLIIPGGESTAIARLMERWGLLEPIRRRARQGMAVWGTCAGAILLAEQADDLDREGLRLMDIDVVRNAFGRQLDSFETDLTVPVLGPRPYHAVFIRAPLIRRVGPGAETLAALPDGTVVAARQEKLLATAFHPELTDDTRFHEYFLSLARKGRAAATTERERSEQPAAS